MDQHRIASHRVRFVMNSPNNEITHFKLLICLDMAFPWRRLHISTTRQRLCVELISNVLLMVFARLVLSSGVPTMFLAISIENATHTNVIVFHKIASQGWKVTKRNSSESIPFNRMSCHVNVIDRCCKLAKCTHCTHWTAAVSSTHKIGDGRRFFLSLHSRALWIWIRERATFRWFNRFNTFSADS